MNAARHISGRQRRLFPHVVGLLILIACLSGPAHADLTVTQLANEGVMITDGEIRILIDAMVVEPYSVYGGLPEDVIPMFDGVSGPFSRIDQVLVSHRHHDHNQPAFACQFMQNSPETKLASSAQVLGLMRERCRQFITTSPRVQEIDPQYEAPHVIELDGAKITAFPLSHGTRKYARLQNYGHLVEMGGLTILHMGDAAMDPTDFARAGLDSVQIDVALIPFWYFQPGPGSEVIDRFMASARKIAVHIPPGEMQEVSDYMSGAYPAVLILKKTLDKASFSAIAQPLP
jgi:L-ascorbate metabolism protein UlaG (beta-lactamase superfamily)